MPINRIAVKIVKKAEIGKQYAAAYDVNLLQNQWKFMPQTLPSTFSRPGRPDSHRSNLPMRYLSGINSLEGLLQAMEHYLLLAKSQLRQPRKKVIDFILKEASLLN